MNAKTLLTLSAATLILAACSKKPDDQAAAPAEASAPAPAAPPPMTASVTLAPTQGNTAAGNLTLTAEGSGLHVTGSLTGLKPDAEFGFHIHEKGDCSAPDASSAGDHFNPTNMQHGDPNGTEHHAGDMLNAKSDAQGTAQVDVTANGVSLVDTSTDNVHGRAIVLHEKADDYKTQPSGDSGKRIACGVIN